MASTRGFAQAGTKGASTTGHLKRQHEARGDGLVAWRPPGPLVSDGIGWPHPNASQLSQGLVVYDSVASSCKLDVWPAATSVTCPLYLSAGANEGPYTHVPFTRG